MIKDLSEIVLTVNVTREDIDNGFRTNPEICPIALAVRRALRERNYEPYELQVDGSIEVDRQSNTPIRYNDPKPQDIWQFIHRFDAEDYVAPFSFYCSFYPREQEEKEYEYIDDLEMEG